MSCYIFNTCRNLNEEIKVLEDELPKAQALVYPVTGMEPEQFDSQTLAMMRGRSVRYLMRSREVRNSVKNVRM